MDGVRIWDARSSRICGRRRNVLGYLVPSAIAGVARRRREVRDEVLEWDDFGCEPSDGT